ncbi:Na(+)-translocating NADH-quinone reductase subunit C [Fulvitalea axinellae]|uniref:Na(+)-translocating NADH-quinone reductase subunit C n=1 Tax=Fulvitalea axinellae TaxID=1182444 RepID=A0AAU9D2S1_9BACT|nr:Na(+)-translocating NADH-quinone reductase subunit C [Fulvitalea axinellae]
MQQSNSYIITFAIAMTVIVGGLLAGANQILKPAQQKALKLDKQKAILGTVITLKEGDNVNDLFTKNIKSEVVDYQGNVVEGVKASSVVTRKQYKQKDKTKKLFPVYKYEQNGKVDAYILPIYGNGLWNEIWGYIALQGDLKTVKGVVFDHAGETPGLGARITEGAIQKRYQNKLIFDQDGKLVSVTMVKGEGNPESALGKYKVDGMSGATLTANGVNAMLYNYLDLYLPYIKKQQNK